VLFNPFEEKFNVPAGVIELGDDESVECEIVCEKYEHAVMFAIKELDTTQVVRILPVRLPHTQCDCLINSEPRRFVNSIRVDTRKVQSLFGTDDEECL
jgi:hypothetical protein